MTTKEPHAGGATFDERLARIAVGAYDDAQDTRTAAMNRVRDILRKKNEDIPFNAVEESKDDDEDTFDSEYEDEALPDLIETMERAGTLTAREREYVDKILSIGQTAADIEDEARDVMGITESEPIYRAWLTNVYGVSSTLTARLIDTFGYCGPVTVVERETDEVVYDERTDGFDGAVDAMDRAKAANHAAFDDDDDPVYDVSGRVRPTQIWSYCGLAPGQTRERGKRSWYDTDAKTLAWLVADNMVKQGDNSRYRTEFYDPYKETQERRLELDADGLCIDCGECDQADDEDYDVCHACYDRRTAAGDGVPSAPNSQGHADTRARRYLAKKFLKHYLAIARDLKGLPTQDEWVIAHGGHDKCEHSFENPFHARRALEGDV